MHAGELLCGTGVVTQTGHGRWQLQVRDVLLRGDLAAFTGACVFERVKWVGSNLAPSMFGDVSSPYEST